MCTVPSVSSVLKITYLASKQLLGYTLCYIWSCSGSVYGQVTELVFSCSTCL